MNDKYESIDEIKKHDLEAKTLEEVLKFNPYHDALGRFSSANGAHSFTFRTNSPAGQKAIANIRAKEKKKMEHQAAVLSAAKPPKPKKEQSAAFGNTKKQKKHKIESDEDSWLEWDDVTDKTVKKVAKDLKVPEEKARDMANSIHSYSGMNYEAIRDAAIGKNDNPKLKAAADNIEDFIKASPKWAGGQLFRGIKVNEAVANEILRKATSGEEIDMLGPASWSSDMDVAHTFAGKSNQWGKAIVFVNNKKSTTAGTSIKHLSQVVGEDEVLMSKDARLKPTKIEEKDGRIYIYGDLP